MNQTLAVGSSYRQSQCNWNRNSFTTVSQGDLEDLTYAKVIVLVNRNNGVASTVTDLDLPTVFTFTFLAIFFVRLGRVFGICGFQRSSQNRSTDVTTTAVVPSH